MTRLLRFCLFCFKLASTDALSALAKNQSLLVHTHLSKLPPNEWLWCRVTLAAKIASWKSVLCVTDCVVRFEKISILWSLSDSTSMYLITAAAARRPDPAVSSCGSSRARSCHFARSRRHRRPRRPSWYRTPKRVRVCLRQTTITVPARFELDLELDPRCSTAAVAAGRAGSIASGCTIREWRPICGPWSSCCGSDAGTG